MESRAPALSSPTWKPAPGGIYGAPCAKGLVPGAGSTGGHTTTSARPQKRTTTKR